MKVYLISCFTLLLTMFTSSAFQQNTTTIVRTVDTSTVVPVSLCCADVHLPKTPMQIKIEKEKRLLDKDIEKAKKLLNKKEAEKTTLTTL
jgi:Skp family chaperone for outer membrane proteins